jgi:tetratricopeptide (TPR) repeat protein
VILIDAAHGREVAVLALPTNHPLRFDRQEQAIWTHGNNGLLRWPIRPAGTRAGEIRVGPPERLSRSRGASRSGAGRDGSVLAFPTYDGASLWHRSSNRVIRLGPHEDVRYSAVSPDGRWAATGSYWLHEGSGAMVWDAVSGQHIADLPVGGLCDVDFSPNGRWLLTSGDGCRLWEVGTWREGANLGASADNTAHAFTADEKVLALADQPGVVRLVSPDSGKELARLTIPEADYLLPHCFTPDARYLAVIGNPSWALYLFDLATLRRDLRELGLDWDNSPLPPISEEPTEPIHVTVDLGDFQRSLLAGELVDKAGQLEQAQNYRESLAVLREAIKADPNHVLANNNLAWLLVAGPKELRDAQTALPLARKAVELEPQNALYLNTLGVALYRNGKYAEAISVLEKSLAASRGRSDAFDQFFLAMCHHQLGEPAKAKDCYDQALKWVQGQHDLPASWIEDLTAFQAEADGLFAHGKSP